MRSGFESLSRILATFVHRDVPAVDAGAHVVALRRLLLQGGVAALVVPVVATGPVWLSFLASAWLVACVVLFAVLSATGRLSPVHLAHLSLVAVTLVVVSAVMGGLGALSLLWLAILPLEAAFVGRHRSILVALATTGCLIAVATVAMLWPNGPLAPVASAGPEARLLLVAFALAYALSLAWRVERRRAGAQRRIDAQENRFRLIAEHSGDLITSHAPSGETLYASAAAHTLVGCAPHALEGSGFFERVHVQDRVSFRHAIASSAGEARDADCRFRVARGGGDHVWMDMRCRPVLDGAGRVEEVVAVTRDVSAAVDRELVLETAHREAERISEAKSHFLAVVSHELRTPLNAIIGFSDLMRLMGPTLPDAKRREYVGLIHQSGSHLLAMVNDLLDASRLEAGRYELDLARTDCADAVRDCASMLAPVAQGAGVSIDVAASAAPLEADERALRQIVTNLLGNAVKFSPAGTSVRVEARKHWSGVTLAVTDRGMGMSESEVARLGEPFTQLCEGHDRKHEGAGLGLSIVKGLVDLHGGSIRFESAPGRGTRVEVKLPLRPPVRRSGQRVVRLAEHAAAFAPAATEQTAQRSTEYGRVSA